MYHWDGHVFVERAGHQTALFDIFSEETMPGAYRLLLTLCCAVVGAFTASAQTLTTAVMVGSATANGSDSTIVPAHLEPSEIIRYD